MPEVGALIAKGRECDIYEYGRDAVLRRARKGYSLESEARAMQFVADQGFPTVKVIDLLDDGRDMVLERVDGPSLADSIKARPWTMTSAGRVLASLHQDLHAIDAPDWFPAYDDGRSVLHRDFHPLNVLMAAHGPVVIDWANAARGHAEVDVADAWLVMAAGGLDDVTLFMRALLSFRRVFVSAFVGAFDRATLVPYLRAGLDMRVLDHNMRPAEIDAMRKLVEREERRLRARG
jgi:Ser/Thr protein kinase RdoA (MazF antagonist)